MNPLALIWNSYLRWRHSHGFGVHSPFAFNLVTTAVRPGNYGYYGYYDIEEAIYEVPDKNYPELEHDACLLLRMLVNLKSERLLLNADAHKAFCLAASAAGIPVKKIYKSDDTKPRAGDLALIDNTLICYDKISELLKSGSAVMGIGHNGPWLSDIGKELGYGLLMRGRRIFIAVPNKDMMFVEYSMKF